MTTLLLAAVVLFYLFNLPDTGKLATVNPNNSAIRMFREKKIRKAGGKPRSASTWRSLDQISHYLIHAVVLSEDDTFFTHKGFDFAQIKRALRINWERKRFVFGGSTLTQQLARTLYLSNNKNLLRKVKEALITLRLEKTLSKKRIIELYLNVVEWGPQVYGAEAASRHFFNKSALELTVEEAISLAAILPSPRRWDPLSEKNYMIRRKSVLYNRMVTASFIPPRVSSETKTSPLFKNEPSSDDEDDVDLVPDNNSP